MENTKELSLAQQAVTHIVELLIITIILQVGLPLVNWPSVRELCYPATVYENGIPVDTIQVNIEGRYWGSLLEMDHFRGTIWIQNILVIGGYCDSLNVQWKTFEPFSSFYCMPQSFIFHSCDPIYCTVPQLMINRRMDAFALRLWDGRVVATSDAMQEEFVKKWPSLLPERIVYMLNSIEEEDQERYLKLLRAEYEKDPLNFYRTMTQLKEQFQYIEIFVNDIYENGEWEAFQAFLTDYESADDAPMLNDVIRMAREQASKMELERVN